MNKHLLAPFAAFLALAATPLLAQTPGSLTFERWTGISGGNGINLLKEKGISQRPADISELVAGAAIPTNLDDHYGARLRGTVTAPVTGNYTFFISSDNNGELWFSETSAGMSKRLIAHHSGYTGFNVWDKFDSQRSRTFTLQAGQKCYVEALMKENYGGDHLSIGWSYEAAVALQQTDMGNPVTAGWTEHNGTYTASVVSGDIWGSSDRCSTFLRPWSGDGEFITRISGMNNPEEWAKAGIMVRGDMGSGAQNAMMARTGSHGVTFQYRSGTDSSRNTPLDTNMEWVKLVRKGDLLSGYVSEDGITWSSNGSATLTGLPTNIYVGLAASNYGSNSPVIATFSDFSASPLTASEVIPASQLASFVADPMDSDGDNLPDAWQSQFPITGTAFEKSEFGDPDNDLLTNLEESQLGTDPNTLGDRPGHWLREIWYETVGYDVADLIKADAFYQTPDFIGLSAGSTAQQDSYNGTRMRAVLTAPETGGYIFWVSGRGGTELWLSTDDTKYAKQRIAVMGASAGTGHGVRSSSAAIWDTFASQMSAPVQLVAGEKYFIEILGQNGHIKDNISLAWAPPGQEREWFDASHIVPYAKELEDAEDDYLPDAWEAQYGLDPLDNGLVDRARQGERGDFDSDGLSNREEYLHGTNPANADTDGDGINDAAEINALGTDPLASDAPAETIASTLDLSSYSTADYNWSLVNGSLLSDIFRGAITWNFSAPTSGTWVIQVDTTLRGTLYPNEIVHVNANIDGKFVGRYALKYGANHKAILRIISPSLTAGSHSLTLMIDNLFGRRAVQLDSITLRQPSGIDADADGIPDWIESRLAGVDYLSSHPSASRTSPFCLEGHARLRGDLLLNGQPVLAGGDGTHWYTDLALNENSSTTYTAAFANGQTSTASLDWQSTNILDGEALTIRKGDSLKLTVRPGGSATGLAASIDFGTELVQLADDNSHVIRLFDQAGIHTVTASHADGSTGTLSVNVLQSTMPDDTSVVQNTVSYLTLDDDETSQSLYFEGGEGLDLSAIEVVDSSRFRFRLYPHNGGRLGVVARLWQGGPILDVADITSVTLTDALQNGIDATFVSQDFPGYYLVTTPMVVLDLPPGGKVVITIFRSGVTFLDGTKKKTLYASDFTNGMTLLQFLFPQGMSGGYCHYIDIYGANGEYLGRR